MIIFSHVFNTFLDWALHLANFFDYWKLISSENSLILSRDMFIPGSYKYSLDCYFSEHHIFYLAMLKLVCYFFVAQRV